LRKSQGGSSTRLKLERVLQKKRKKIPQKIQKIFAYGVTPLL
jgi:hypothetical protein